MSEAEINLDAPPDLSQRAAQIAKAANACLASVSQPRFPTCLSCAITIALSAARQFQPRYTSVPEVKWCGPQGQPAPSISFPNDFIDRRTTLAWALARMTISNPVDEPIFSAQARVTMHSDTLATFRNFNAPAATVISSLGAVPIDSAVEIPESIRHELLAAELPVVYVVLNQMAGFEDVILYTSLFNFSHAFAAFQIGPWRSLKQALAAQQRMLDDQAFPLLERRAIERAALAVLEQAWENARRQPPDQIQPMLVDLLSGVQQQVKI